MSTPIKVKSSATPGKVPTTTDLQLGELAINTYDGKLYTKKNDGFDTIVDLSSGQGANYTAGDGIAITGTVISSTVKSAGTDVFAVQIGDGEGNFAFVPPQDAGRVLTSNGTDSPTWEPVPVSGGTVRSVAVVGGSTGLTTSGGPVTVEGTITLDGVLNLAHGGTGGATATDAANNILPTQTGHANAALYTDGAGALSWQVPPGTAYTAGTGLNLTGTTFNSTVADNSGQANRVTISTGDGTLHNLAAGTAGFVLTSAGAGADPTWANALGTVSDIQIVAVPSMGLHITGGNALTPPVANTTEITTTGTISLAGTLAILNGGTGATTTVNARTNLLPTQTGHTTLEFLTTNGTDVSWAKPLPDQTTNTGKFLTTDGTVASWATPGGGGTVTSVQASGGTTGLTFAGGPVTSSGTLTLAGTLAIANGGTGQTTAPNAINALVPSQASAAGQYLSSNGTVVSWGTPTGLGGTVTSVDVSAVGTGLTFTGGPITSSGTISLGGTLNIATGGTGGTTAVTARTNLLPSQASNAGKILGTNGTDVSWVASSSGSVTSVNVDGSTTGLTFTGGPITTSGTLTLAGTLAIANGGTGQTTAATAINALVPSQTGNSGKVLSTNGTVVGWSTASAGSVTSVNVDGSTTGLTFTGGPITSSGTITLAGTLALANGGTGGSSAQVARNNILPVQTSHAGQVLVTDGTDVSWSSTTGTGTVTSVQASGGTTGLTFAGGPVTSSGTLTLSGTLAIANGGTGQTTAATAINALVPTQTSAAGQFLSTNGTVVSWGTPATSGGTVTSVQASGGTTGLTFAGGPVTSSGTLTLAGTLAIANGGTGQTTAPNAINALVPSQTGNSGKVLSTNGTVIGWSTASSGSVTSVNVDGSTTGLTFTGGPITSSGTLTLAGTLALANGGTGGTSAQTARNNILPVQTSHAGQVLVTDGTDVSWSSTTGTGTVTSVNVDGSTTGLTFTGGPITSSGTLTLAGTLALANGGTGQTTAVNAINALVPSQTGNSGRYLTTNGTAISWGATGGGTVTSVAFSTGTTGLSVTGSPITSSGTITLSGTLAITNGGTGATTATAALTALLPSQTSAAGQYLTTNGTTASWGTANSGTVTSVQASGGTTGLTFAGGPVTTSGTLTLAGTLAIANGGTGQTTASGAINALVPSQTTAAGQVLTSNGTVVSWGSVGTYAAGTGLTLTGSTFSITPSGVTAGTYTKVTVNASGQVTVGAAVSSSDITTSLGYTPVNRAGDTMTGALNFASPVTIAAAGTMAIGAAAANAITVSGTATITAFDTIAAGARRYLMFTSAGTILTYNVTSMILPTLANILVQAGDVAEFVSWGAGNWKCVGYVRANGNPVGLTFNGTATTPAVKLTNAVEVAALIATAPPTTTNMYAALGAVQYYTAAATAAWVVNFAWSSTASMDSVMVVGDSLTMALVTTQGGTAFFPSSYTVDGAAITPKWQGGVAPVAGNASGIDTYSFTLIKTASATYTLLAALTQYK